MTGKDKQVTKTNISISSHTADKIRFFSVQQKLSQSEFVEKAVQYYIEENCHASYLKYLEHKGKLKRE